jgi:hypothetical protein
MGPIAYLRRKRERKQFAEKVLADIKLIEGPSLSRSFSSDNNYFSCALMLLRVEQAVKHKDHDSLVVYDRYMHASYPYEAVHNAMRVLRFLGHHRVAGVITDEHVRVSYRIGEGFVERPRYAPFRGTKEHDAVLGLIFGNMEQAERIIMLVTERNITDAALISEMLESGEGSAAPLMSGEL